MQLTVSVTDLEENPLEDVRVAAKAVPMDRQHNVSILDGQHAAVVTTDKEGNGKLDLPAGAYAIILQQEDRKRAGITYELNKDRQTLILRLGRTQ
jgi:hypothetical protein